MDKYEYQGKTFEINDSEGCYLVVTFKGLGGYVGVNLQGTATEPYGWTIDNQTGISHIGSLQAQGAAQTR